MPAWKRKYKPKITHRARKLVQNLAKGMTAKQAAIQAGYSPKNASVSANQALSYVRKAAPELMDELGLTERALIKNHLKPLLRATRTKHFQYKGKVRDTRKEAALDIRRDALELALKIQGSFAPVKTEEKSTKAVRVIVLDVPRPPREHPPDTVIELATSDGNEENIAVPKQPQRPELGTTSIEVKPPNNGSKE